MSILPSTVTSRIVLCRREVGWDMAKTPKELLWQKEICHLPCLFLHTLTGKLTWLARDSPGYLSTLSPSPTKLLTLFLKTLDTSPNPIPQASSSRPWQSRWLMADGTM